MRQNNACQKVALALSELVLNSYSHDSLNCILFGDNAWEVKIDDLLMRESDPFQTNTKAGLEPGTEDSPKNLMETNRNLL
jgi:uncharacterized protein with von Willebrand factor type A (vWA) domain